MAQRRVLALLIAVLFALPLLPGGAQKPASTIADDEDLTGLQAAV